MAYVGDTGTNLEYSHGLRKLPKHLHFTVWSKTDDNYVTGETDGGEYVWAKYSSVKNPHNLWAPHPQDIPNKVKFIPFVKEGRSLASYNPGITYMVKG